MADDEKQVNPESGSEKSAPDPADGPEARRPGKDESSRPEVDDALQPESKSPTGKPPVRAKADSGDDAQAAAPGPKPAVPKPPATPKPPPKPKGPQREPYSGPLIDALKSQFPEELLDAYTFLGARHLVIRKGRLGEVMAFMRRNEIEPFDFLSDETATHWPKDEEFELVYVLFSFRSNTRVIVKTRTKEWESIESLVALWPGADWLEREIYDMYGVRFVNHPNLKRILLPEDWVGFPLRKDYNIRLQDVEWVRKHLGIESGQRFYVGEARHDDT